MNSERGIMKYKREFIFALFGALLTGVVSLSVGLYSLTKSFEMSLNKDRILNLRSDIRLLKKVKHELNYNIDLLLNKDLKPHIEFKKFVPQISANEDKEYQKFIKQYLQIYLGDSFVIDKITVPTYEFYNSAWPYSGPRVSEINFDLSQTIQELYLMFHSVSESLGELNYMIGKQMFTSSGVRRVNSLIERVNEDIDYISNENILKLKDKVSSEIIILEKKLSKILK